MHSRGCSPAAWLGRRDWGDHVLTASPPQAAGSPALGDSAACVFPCSDISSPQIARGERAGSEGAQRSCFGGCAESVRCPAGKWQRLIRAEPRSCTRSPDPLKPLQRTGRGSYSTRLPPDFSVVRVGWGRGEGREVTSLPSLSTPTPVLTCYFLPLHAPEAKLWDGFSSSFSSAAPLAAPEGNFDKTSGF